MPAHRLIAKVTIRGKSGSGRPLASERDCPTDRLTRLASSTPGEASPIDSLPWLPMGTKSAFVFHDTRWLVAEPEGWYRREFLTEEEMFEPIWSLTTGSGLTVAATVGQLVIIDFESWPAARGADDSATSTTTFLETSIAAMRARVQIANALALAIHSATVTVQNLSTGGFRITHEQLLHFHSSGNGISNSSQFSRLPGRGVLMPRHRSGVIASEVLQRACEILDEVVTHEDERTLDLVELLNTSLVACRGHDFDLATVAAWSICEAVLGTALNRYTREHARAHDLLVNRARRDQWDALNAATTTEILSLAGVLSSDLDQRLRSTRVARNKWIHAGTPVSYRVATDAVQLAADMLARFGWPCITVSPSVGVQGLEI